MMALRTGDRRHEADKHLNMVPEALRHRTVPPTAASVASNVAGSPTVKHGNDGSGGNGC